MRFGEFLEFFGAVLSGVVIRILFERHDEKYRKPVRRIAELRSEILSALLMYERFYVNVNVNFNDDEERRRSDATVHLRKLATDLGSAVEMLYYHRNRKCIVQQWLERARVWMAKNAAKDIPSKGDLRSVMKNLIGLSNSFYPRPGRETVDQIESNEAYAKTIRRLLSTEDSRFEDETEALSQAYFDAQNHKE